MLKVPLALYIHIPWCIQKCPYCDFNSHGLKDQIPEKAYVSHLLDDLQQDAGLVGDRQVSSIFIGGGTPSLFSPEAIASLLTGVRQRVNLAKEAEITLEANPGAAEAERFAGFQQAGVTRLSIGVQSFQNAQLQHLGRVHDCQQAEQAVNYAQQAQLSSFNLDLMHGLPQQSVDKALADLEQGTALKPPHLSWYQLTIEPNTQFYSKPPVLPNDDILWDIQLQGQALLQRAGYQQYEVSAYSLPDHQCQHNLNYWRFGDYLGIGCGAHAKITDLSSAQIRRTVKVKHPKGYMDLSRSYLDKSSTVAAEDLAFEFFMNRFRLLEACPTGAFGETTGQEPDQHTMQNLNKAADQGLLTIRSDSWKVTELGRRYLNSLLSMFV